MTPLRTLYTDPYADLPLGCYYPARIMSPQEVSSAITTSTRGLSELLERRWMLCGDVAAETFALMRQIPLRDVACRVSAFTSSNFGNYAVIAHQVSTHHHRFVLPLWDPEVIAFIRALQTQPHGFMLGCAGAMDAVVLPGFASAGELRPLLRFCSEPTEQEFGVLIGELPLVIATMARVDAIPSVDAARPVTTASMSFCLPARISDFLGRPQPGLH